MLSRKDIHITEREFDRIEREHFGPGKTIRARVLVESVGISLNEEAKDPIERNTIDSYRKEDLVRGIMHHIYGDLHRAFYELEWRVKADLNLYRHCPDLDRALTDMRDLLEQTR